MFLAKLEMLRAVHRNKNWCHSYILLYTVTQNSSNCLLWIKCTIIPFPVTLTDYWSFLLPASRLNSQLVIKDPVTTNTCRYTTCEILDACLTESAKWFPFSPRDAMLARYMLSSCVRPSVRHKPVSYRNDWTNWAGFWHARLSSTYPTRC